MKCRGQKFKCLNKRLRILRPGTSNAQCIQESILVALNEKVNFQQTTNEVCEMAPLVLFMGLKQTSKFVLNYLRFFFSIQLLQASIKTKARKLLLMYFRNKGKLFDIQNCREQIIIITEHQCAYCIVFRSRHNDRHKLTLIYKFARND